MGITVLPMQQESTARGQRFELSLQPSEKRVPVDSAFHRFSRLAMVRRGTDEASSST